MVRLAQERVLLIGDARRDVHGAILQAVPGADVTSVGSFFDAIAELSANAYTTVLAAAEPIERRPEAAVRALRDLTGEGRIILFGHPTLELLSRKMMQFGCDDYIVTPASAGEIQQVFGAPRLRLAEGQAGAEHDAPAAAPEADAAAAAPAPPALATLPLAELLLDALLQSPHDAPAAAIRAIDAGIGPAMTLAYRPLAADPPAAPEGKMVLAQAVRSHGEEAGALYLTLAPEDDHDATRHALAQIGHLVGKLVGLRDRHNGLQKLAITDELTGVYNARYFRHFLARIIDKAKKVHFPVTLLLFDIDDFKKYNDQFGHGVGDEILRQTAALMKRCTREHDLVARIGGDEFAVVFWDKKGPRQPKKPKPGVTSLPPQTPRQVFDRFKAMIQSEDFPVLGQSGKGKLGVSAGLAVYPYEAHDAASLIEEADRALMQGAKKNGKNSLYIVGADEPPTPPEEGNT